MESVVPTIGTMATPPLHPGTSNYVAEFIAALFFVVLSALGIVFRMYIGRITLRLDQVAERLGLLEQERQRKWSEHIEQNALRQLEVEKRLSRCELIAETLFKMREDRGLHRRLEAYDEEPPSSLIIRRLEEG